MTYTECRENGLKEEMEFLLKDSQSRQISHEVANLCVKPRGQACRTCTLVFSFKFYDSSIHSFIHYRPSRFKTTLNYCDLDDALFTAQDESLRAGTIIPSDTSCSSLHLGRGLYLTGGCLNTYYGEKTFKSWNTGLATWFYSYF